ncbi:MULTISPECIES: DNA circularization N-terminal domain-containing protein [unclassified Rhizobium]|uniref:DNA circularization N-terminal domain-containing protein n=1 Tax=unclassified Rhizobium TaxID=2613769 RepID=UPI00146F67D6|nr:MULTISPECIES: DNA circularization N-terminal domain-containing protein [unclassified Rhizobium]MBD9445757.1 DNA circularization N-terminal domain-containing protein [Rhizobium sp. RHZ01]NMN73857.1 Mu-like prophage DNA circulation protein [Rhizobium sp. 57MFTsu3.2]
MRDWTKTLRRASYRGVEFWVDYEDLSGGKRLAIHQYAGGRQTLVEELGLATTAYGLTIYFVSDVADAEAKLFSAAMLSDGPGYLILPIDGGMMATAQDFRRSREQLRNGYIGFDVTFIPSLTDGGRALSIGDVSAAVASGFAAAAAQFAKLF